MSGARRIDGKALAGALQAEIASEVAILKESHALTPCLAVILVGDDPASQIYVDSKTVRSREAGMKSCTYRLPVEIVEAALLSRIDALNADPDIHGILCQFPLPGHIDRHRVVERIAPEKDVDGLNPVNAGRLVAGLPALAACTPAGCVLLAREALGTLTGRHVVIIGRSGLVGKPAAQLFLMEDCTVTVAHSRSRDLADICRSGDILVAAAGQPALVKADWIKPGALVIDVGIHRLPAPERGPGKTRLVGDVDVPGLAERAGAFTPVPGGVGPMTVACLLRNTLLAACRSRDICIPEKFAPRGVQCW